MTRATESILASSIIDSKKFSVLNAVCAKVCSRLKLEILPRNKWRQSFCSAMRESKILDFVLRA